MSRKAFTLIELLIVITILLIMTGLSVSLVNSAINNDRIRSSARQTQSALAGAKDRAIRAGRDAPTLGSSSGTQRGLRFILDQPSLNSATATVSSFVYVQELPPARTGYVFLDATDASHTFVQLSGASIANLIAQGLITSASKIQINGDGRWYGINLSASNPAAGELTLSSAYLNYSAGVNTGLPNGQPFVWDANDSTRFTSAGTLAVPASGFSGPNTFVYSSSGGTTGTIEPNWPTVVGATVNDGTILWTCQSGAGVARLPFQLTLGNAVLPNAQPIQLSSGITINLLTSAAINKLPDYSQGYFDVMFSPRGSVYGPLGAKGLINFYLASTEDVVASNGTGSGPVYVWQPNTPYSVGQMVVPAAGSLIQFTCFASGTSGASPPTWPTAVDNVQFTDGSVTWAATTSIVKDKLVCTLSTLTGNVATYPVNVNIPTVTPNGNIIDPFLFARQGSTAGR